MASGSVQQIGLKEAGQFDLLQTGIDAQGRKVSLAFSEVTGEIYTYVQGAPPEDDKLVEVYGRVGSIEEARAVAAVAIYGAQPGALLEPVARLLNDRRYLPPT